MSMNILGLMGVEKTPIIQDETIPTQTASIEVVGAGTTSANGIYTWSDGLWIKTGLPNYAIFRAGSGWQIFSDEIENEFKYSNNGGDASNLPRFDWNVEDGTAPAPQINIA